jgi:FkbM family methyltransferase
MTFIDGGANDGLYSLFAAQRVGPGGTVVAVEPSERELGRLCANLALNPDLRIVPVQAALGQVSGEAVLAVAESGHEGQNTIGNRVSNPKVATERHETVPITTLDALVEEQGLERVDFVKLDVEGSEVDALLGATGIVARFRPLFQIEAEDERLASQGRKKDDLRELLNDFGYELFVFDAETGKLRPAHGAGEPEGNAVAAPRGWRRSKHRD